MAILSRPQCVKSCQLSSLHHLPLWCGGSTWLVDSPHTGTSNVAMAVMTFHHHEPGSWNGLWPSLTQFCLDYFTASLHSHCGRQLYAITENQELLQCQLCCHRWHHRLSKTTTCGATSDNKVGIMTTLGFQWHKESWASRLGLFNSHSPARHPSISPCFLCEVVAVLTSLPAGYPIWDPLNTTQISQGQARSYH